MQAALREAAEEAGIDSSAPRTVGEYVLDHVDWSYTTVLAIGDTPVRPTDEESAAVVWVPLDQVSDRVLLPAFADAWPQLRARIMSITDGS